MKLIDILLPADPPPVVGGRVVKLADLEPGTYAPLKPRKTTVKQRLASREHQRRKRAVLLAAGLTSKGKPRVRF